MKLRLRHLRIRVTTDGGLYGCDLSWGPGLNILHAPNNQGKSTCLMAGLYALGLEGALTSRHAVPLTHALTTELENEEGVPLAVVESWVELEVENEGGERVTIQRPVVNADRDTHLVRVFDPSKSVRRHYRDYFVRRAGAAQNEAGFHSFLAGFLGFEAPDVRRYDGSIVPLYLECLVPFLFVEQKTGWASIQLRQPTYLGIREMPQRSLEYLLDLDIASREQERRSLAAERERLRSEWVALREATAASLRVRRMRLTGVPAEPVATWPGTHSPTVVARIEEHWVDIEAAIDKAKHDLAELTMRRIPEVADEEGRLSAALNESRSKLGQVLTRVRAVEIDVSAYAQELKAVDRRLRAIAVDLQRNKDAKTIQRLGGEAVDAVDSGQCPACGQEVSDTLLPQVANAVPMTIDDNIQYLRGQQQLFEQARVEAQEAHDDAVELKAALEAEATNIRRLIRSQQESLVADGRQPSVAAIRERLTLEDQLEDMEESRQELDRLSSSLAPLAAAWLSVEAKLRDLGERQLSIDDARKLRALEQSIQTQLAGYGFSSVPVDQVKLSDNLLRPTHEGFDLGFDISASDMIRLIWSYLLGLFEVGQKYSTCHPGILVLDEPKQQSASRLSYISLLERAKAAISDEQQIIFATSEDDPSVLAAMDRLADHVIRFDRRLLQRIEG